MSFSHTVNIRLFDKDDKCRESKSPEHKDPKKQKISPYKDALSSSNFDTQTQLKNEDSTMEFTQAYGKIYPAYTPEEHGDTMEITQTYGGIFKPPGGVIETPNPEEAVKGLSDLLDEYEPPSPSADDVEVSSPVQDVFHNRATKSLSEMVFDEEEDFTCKEEHLTENIEDMINDVRKELAYKGVYRIVNNLNNNEYDYDEIPLSSSVPSSRLLSYDDAFGLDRNEGEKDMTVTGVIGKILSGTTPTKSKTNTFDLNAKARTPTSVSKPNMLVNISPFSAYESMNNCCYLFMPTVMRFTCFCLYYGSN